MDSVFNMNGEYDRAEQILRDAFKTLAEKPKDRLSFLQGAFKLRNAIIGTLRFLDPLADSELSSKYPLEDLKLVYAYLADSARPLQDMMEYFLKKAREEAGKASLAV